MDAYYTSLAKSVMEEKAKSKERGSKKVLQYLASSGHRRAAYKRKSDSFILSVGLILKKLRFACLYVSYCYFSNTITLEIFVTFIIKKLNTEIVHGLDIWHKL